MAPSHTLTLGVDAPANCLARFIHPSSLIREKYSNVLPTMRFANLKVLRMERKIVSRRFQERIVFSSPIFPDVEFHLVRTYYKVTHEGLIKHFFELEAKVGVIEEVEVPKAPNMVNKIERRGSI